MEQENSMQHPQLRDLLQVPDTENIGAVTHVHTPEGLQKAVSAGIRHIEVREHMDLTALEPFDVDLSSGLLTILNPSDATVSIRVRSWPMTRGIVLNIALFPFKLLILNPCLHRVTRSLLQASQRENA
jgi:hypothetical protein